MSSRLLRELEAEPGRLWVRFAPLRWPAPPCAWVDVAAGTLGASTGEAAQLDALAQTPVEDVLYLRPVPPVMAEARDRLAARHAARGTPVLVQVLPGDPAPVVVEGVTVIVDVLPLLISAPVAGALPGSAPTTERVAIWPLAPGIGTLIDAEKLLPALALAGITTLHPVRVELSGRERRELGGELAEERYLELFHGATVEPAGLARIAGRHGLATLLPRPLPRPPLRGAANLRVADALARAGELALWAGEPESRAQALLRAARFAERSPHDLTALAREGNLGVLPWLDGEAREIASSVAAGEEPGALKTLTERLRA